LCITYELRSNSNHLLPSQLMLPCEDLVVVWLQPSFLNILMFYFCTFQRLKQTLESHSRSRNSWDVQYSVNSDKAWNDHLNCIIYSSVWFKFTVNLYFLVDCNRRTAQYFISFEDLLSFDMTLLRNSFWSLMNKLFRNSAEYQGISKQIGMDGHLIVI